MSLRPPPRIVAASLAIVSLATALACADATDPDSRPVVARLAVAGLPDSIGAGDTLRLTAVALDAAGAAIPGVAVRWRSLHPGFATIDSATGRVVTGFAGDAELVAAVSTRAGEVADTVVLRVRRLPRRIVLGGLADSLLVSHVDTAVAAVYDGLGDPLPATVRWSVSDAGLFFVDSVRGRIFPRDQGSAWLYARAGTLVDSVRVRAAYHEIGLPTTFGQLAIGDFASWCGRTPGGEAWCTPHLFARPDFARVAGTPEFRDLQAAYGYACGLAADDRAWCWGYNSSGQLGRGTTSPVGQELAPAPALGGRPLRQIAVGQGFAQSACGIDAADSTVVCWGFNGYYNTGSTDLGVDSIPGPVAGGLKALQLDAGPYHACAIALDRSVWCWGSRKDYGLPGESMLPEQVEPPGDWVQVEANAGMTCLLSGGGTVRCRTLVDYSPGSTPLVLTVGGDARYVRLFTSYWGTICGITDAGALWCWRTLAVANAGTTLPPRAIMPQHRFVSMGFGDGSGIVGRFDHACALTTDSRMFCW